MTDSDTNLLCEQAGLYYYDFLHKESCEPVPESIINHIECCEYCQQQINLLKETLSQTEGPESEQAQTRTVINEILGLHFAYIGRPVTCNIVKPFLPCLSDPALEIRIPTPITAHLDNCRQCREDLETLRSLNLSRKQLRRLSQLFAEKPTEDVVNCLQAQVVIQSIVEMDFRQTGAEVLKHLCVCPDCRELLYQHRQKVYEQLLHSNMIQKRFSCEDVSTTDIFDYCLPYGIDPADDQYAEFREAFTSHASICPTCLGKMQELHKTVYAIVERPESETATICTIDKSAKAKAVGKSGDLYTGFPIKVEVAGRQEQAKAKASTEIIDFTTALRRRVSAVNLRPLLKPAVAIAAVILIASVLLLNTSTAGAITIEQVYKAIEKIKDVYIAKFAPDRLKPKQEKWVSRTLNIYMTKTGKQLVLWDLPNEVRKAKQLDTVVTETIPLTAVSVADVEKRMTGSLGLTPFYDISDVPQDAQWNRVTGEGLKIADKGVEVYDLTWVEEKYGAVMVFSKWRVFVDPKTNLPYRTEFYRKLPNSSEYILESTNVVEYLDDSEMQAVLEKAFF